LQTKYLHANIQNVTTTHTNMKQLLPLLLAASTLTTQANTFGVTGNTGNGSLDPLAIYHINSNATVAKVGTTNGILPNSFAYNNNADVYYYGEHDGTNLYAFDVATSNNVLIADLASYGMPAGQKLSGGADFYNGTYYYTPETPQVGSYPNVTPQQASEIYTATFSPNGLTIVSHDTLNVTLPNGWSSLGDFGDIAVDTQRGILYGASSAIHGGINDGSWLWKIDLADPNKQVQVIAQTSTDNTKAYQLGYDAIEDKLFANSWQSGKYTVINKNTGAEESSNPIAGDFYDLASSALPDNVPEPSSTLLLALAFTSTILRRKR